MNDNPQHDAEDLLVAYVERALHARERGEEIALELLCAEHPELAPAVAEALGLSVGLGAVGRTSQDHDRDLGRVLGDRYRLDARLGRGAMGAVFVARDLELLRDVALKLFDTIGPASDSDETRFQREATALAALHHPNVVAIHDRGSDASGGRYIVMDRLEGATLSALLQRSIEQPPPPGRFTEWFAESLGAEAPPSCEANWLRTAARIARDVARGLGAAHALGIHHRDVKPSNVFVTKTGHTVLLDFGIAAKDGDPALTVGDSTLGTPWYMAPEQVDHRARTGASIDVYGLCATLYHLVTGRPPHEGDALAVVSKLQREDPPPPSRVRSDLPRDLCAILERGMERDPLRRYPDVATVEAELDAFLEHRPVRARPIGRLGRLVRTARRRPAPAVAIALGGLLAVALGVVWPLWSAHNARLDAERSAALFAQMPALIAIDGQPGAPLVHELASGASALGALDELLALEPDDLPHRLWRAVLRLDRGEPELARADFDELIARSAASPFTRALTARYLERGSATEPVDVDPATLPAPTTDFDRFLAAFHELRNRQREGAAERAETLLSACADRYLPARDLRLIALVERGDVEQDARCFERAVDESHWLEGHYGRPTARTLAMRGAALVALRRIEEGVLALEASDAMRPDRHGTLHNLGVAYRRLGQIDRAIDTLRRAYELRPTVWNTPYMLALAYKDRGDFASAFAAADTLDAIDVASEHAWRKTELRATIHFRRGVDSYRTERASSRTDAEAAAKLFATAAGQTTGRAANELTVRGQVAQAIAADDTTSALAGYLALLRRTPDDPYQISNLATLLPADGIDAPVMAHLRRYLRALAIALAKGDPAFRQSEQATVRDERDR